MKTNYLFKIAAGILLTINCSAQATLAQWNFNGPSATEVPGGPNNPLVSAGSGDALLVGGTTATFSSGNTTVGTVETETTSPPNFGWNTSTYAALGTEDKMRGVQFNVSTTGQAGIIFTFEQRLSNKAGNTYVVQYTTDRLAATPEWIDAQTFTVTPADTGTGDTWYNGRTVDLTAVTALDDNANAAFRIVGAFDPGTGNYLAARSTSTYDGSGTVRFDMVTVTSNVTLAATQFAGTDNSFSMSPNPSAKSIVQFNGVINGEVYDATGKLLMHIRNANRIDTSTFKSGVYMVRTSAGATQKLIVQ